MKLVSIDHYPGREFEVLGIVKGTTVQTKHLGKDFMAAMKTLVGGELSNYNEMMNIRDYPELAMDDSEHIVDYEYEYQYCLNISFNEDGTAGRGSAIFLHCFGQRKPYTGGCVAIPENLMKLVMQSVTEDCVVVIDTMEHLNASF